MELSRLRTLAFEPGNGQIRDLHVQGWGLSTVHTKGFLQGAEHYWPLGFFFSVDSNKYLKRNCCALTIHDPSQARTMHVCERWAFLCLAHSYDRQTEDSRVIMSETPIFNIMQPADPGLGRGRRTNNFEWAECNNPHLSLAAGNHQTVD